MREDEEPGGHGRLAAQAAALMELDGALAGTRLAGGRAEDRQPGAGEQPHAGRAPRAAQRAASTGCSGTSARRTTDGKPLERALEQALDALPEGAA